MGDERDGVRGGEKWGRYGKCLGRDWCGGVMGWVWLMEGVEEKVGLILSLEWFGRII